MSILEIFKLLNPTELGNTIFYPLLIILTSNCVALLLLFWDPQNRYMHVFTNIPKIVAISSISINGLWQISKMINSPFLFQAFVLIIGVQTLSGITTEFKLKHIFVSHIIASILHLFFYYYCSHYDAGVISGAFHPAFESLVFLALVYFFVSHFSLPNMAFFSMRNFFIDRLIPTNNENSNKRIVLLQAYSMIIHSTLMVFMYSSTFDYWVSSVIVLCVVLLQCVIVIMCFRMMYIYPSSANTPFYVSAYLMIIKLLIDALCTNYKMFKENKPVNVQPQYFYNKFFYLFVFILVICLLNCDVAIAADEGPSSPVSESNMFNRISQSGLSELLKYAAFYEGISFCREWLEQQMDLRQERDEFSAAVEACHAAKTKLETIPYKYREEFELVKEANYVLKGADLPSELSLGALENYKRDIESITRKMYVKYDTYLEYKNQTTDYLARRLWHVSNCCGPRR